MISIAAPTDEERAHHYLWRFWRHLPRAGRVTIFDRSWYGRVLVERVEGFATETEWRRAYAEINDFEQQLVEHGIVLVKFWIHITPEEQEQRFEARAEIARTSAGSSPTRTGATASAGRDYELAVHDMVERTSTPHRALAPRRGQRQALRAHQGPARRSATRSNAALEQKPDEDGRPMSRRRPRGSAGREADAGTARQRSATRGPAGLGRRTPPDSLPIPAAAADGAFDLASPAVLLNRELTWLNFNFRVLHEAEDRAHAPARAASSSSRSSGSNLDEFFMKRIGGLKQQVGAGVDRLTTDGRSPQQQIDECYDLVRGLEARQRQVLDQVDRASSPSTTSW